MTEQTEALMPMKHEAENVARIVTRGLYVPDEWRHYERSHGGYVYSAWIKGNGKGEPGKVQGASKCHTLSIVDVVTYEIYGSALEPVTRFIGNTLGLSGLVGWYYGRKAGRKHERWKRWRERDIARYEAEDEP